MDKIKEQFEEWFSKEYEEVNNSAELSAKVIKMIALSSWLASTTSNEIELPTQSKYDDPLSAYNAIKDCAEAIRAAGIKVKE